MFASSSILLLISLMVIKPSSEAFTISSIAPICPPETSLFALDSTSVPSIFSTWIIAGVVASPAVTFSLYCCSAPETSFISPIFTSAEPFLLYSTFMSTYDDKLFKIFSLSLMSPVELFAPWITICLFSSASLSRFWLKSCTLM